jgi:hypothetical protein
MYSLPYETFLVELLDGGVVHCVMKCVWREYLRLDRVSEVERSVRENFMQLGGLEKILPHRIDPVLEQHPAAL